MNVLRILLKRYTYGKQHYSESQETYCKMSEIPSLTGIADVAWVGPGILTPVLNLKWMMSPVVFSCTHIISLDPNICDIYLTPCINYTAKDWQC